MSERGLTLLACLATALAAGFVIGAEREQERHATFGGVRTFPLFALAGALGALLHVWVLAGLAVAVGALLRDLLPA
ncbi:MAG: MgtC/SapB family protein [Sandaracinaceae bacterium]|nr:MgtC/SapB family protein [Sandaracinaceae bacterium]